MQLVAVHTFEIETAQKDWAKLLCMFSLDSQFGILVCVCVHMCVCVWGTLNGHQLLKASWH